MTNVFKPLLLALAIVPSLACAGTGLSPTFQWGMGDLPPPTFVSPWSDSTSAASLERAAPNIHPEVAQRALQAVACAQSSGTMVQRLLIVDMGLPSTAKRLWALDLTDRARPHLVLNERVAHGAGSDPDADGRAQSFSNRHNSHMTSLGLYRVAEAYDGKHGGSRRLDGLTPGFNDNARERAVVMHPAEYVGDGHVGRSHGCPAVSPAAMKALEEAGLANALLWIDGPDPSLAQQVAACTPSNERPMSLASLFSTDQVTR